MAGNGNGWTSWTLERAQPTMDAFIARLRDSGNVRAACQAADLPRSTAYHWRNKFKTFSDRWDDAMEDACDVLELEAWRRAMKENSDRLLMFLLKAHRPEKFKNRTQTELTGEDGGPIKYVPVGLNLSDDI